MFGSTVGYPSDSLASCIVLVSWPAQHANVSRFVICLAVLCVGLMLHVIIVFVSVLCHWFTKVICHYYCRRTIAQRRSTVSR